MDFLRFTFQSVWHFAGVFVLLCVVLSGLADIAEKLRGIFR